MDLERQNAALEDRLALNQAAGERELKKKLADLETVNSTLKASNSSLTTLCQSYHQTIRSMQTGKYDSSDLSTTGFSESAPVVSYQLPSPDQLALSLRDAKEVERQRREDMERLSCDKERYQEQAQQLRAQLQEKSSRVERLEANETAAKQGRDQNESQLALVVRDLSAQLQDKQVALKEQVILHGARPA